MLLAPKKPKYRRQMRGTNSGLSTRGNKLQYADYGLKAMERAYITQKQIEAARRAITSMTKRSGKLWITIFPDKPITKKPLETRMGKGKGPVDHYAAVVKPGKIMFELHGVPRNIATESFRRASAKLPIKTKIIYKHDED